MNLTGKSKKSFLKRLKVTKSGKVLSRRTSQNHFRAKQRRGKQLTGKRLQNFGINKKMMGKFLS